MSSHASRPGINGRILNVVKTATEWRRKMSNSKPKVVDVNELAKQTAYAESLEKSGFDYGLAVGSAFAESMRNTFYKHTGTALDEINDNGIEAGASEIHIALGYYGNSDAKPDAIATIDNGHGMVPSMLRLAVLWGGTHREGSRAGFGRFGFGLPSASVNQCRRFSVYSITEGGSWHSVVVDLDDMRDGKYTDRRTGRVVMPGATQTAPPEWVLDYIKKNFDEGELSHGTVVLWEKVDRLKWKTTAGMTKNLLEHFGTTYRNYLGSVKLVFNGTRVEPLDPLFTTPGFRYYDLDEQRAIPLDPAEFDVTSKATGEKVKIRIRYARFPLGFFSKDKSKDAQGNNANPRLAVVNEHRGIIVSRMGRQLDVVEHTPWQGLEKFTNNDRYWAAEIDFPAELDEELTVSNSKQGVVMSDRMWDLLKEAGLLATLRTLRKDYQTDVAAKRASSDEPNAKRASEQSMEESAKFKRKRAGTNPVEREKRAREAFEQHVKAKAREEKRPEAEVRRDFEEEVARHPYRVEFEHMPGAPFFRVEQIGGMKSLKINRAHRFYGDIYAAPGNGRRIKASLEILLFAIGECELDAQGNLERRTFYSVERAAWSETLGTALEMLSQFVNDTDIVDAEGSSSETDLAEEAA